jgi:hypothetical protein
MLEFFLKLNLKTNYNFKHIDFVQLHGLRLFDDRLAGIADELLS